MSMIILMTPLKTGDDLELSNRVVMVPTTRARAGEARIPNQIMANYKETAKEKIAQGQADMIAFGRPFIATNPDLVERFTNGWPLAPEAEMATWCSHEESGYNDWPTYR